MVLEIMKPRSAAYNFRSNEKYNYMRIIKSQFILNDNLNQSIIQQTGGNYLMAAALQNLDDAGKWVAPSSSPLLLFLYFFQTSCFQNKNLSRFLVLHNASRIGWSTTPPVKSWARTGLQPNQEAKFPIFESTKCKPFWWSISFGSLRYSYPWF